MFIKALFDNEEVASRWKNLLGRVGKQGWKNKRSKEIVTSLYPFVAIEKKNL